MKYLRLKFVDSAESTKKFYILIFLNTTYGFPIRCNEDHAKAPWMNCILCVFVAIIWTFHLNQCSGLECI